MIRLLLLRDLRFFSIFIAAINSELLTLAFQSGIVRIWAHIKLSLFLLQSERLNQLKLTPLTITVYLSHLPYPTHSHHLSSIRFPKCVRNEGCLTFFTRDLENNNKKHFHSIEIGNDILIYININKCSKWKLITHAASETLKCLNTTGDDS